MSDLQSVDLDFDCVSIVQIVGFETEDGCLGKLPQMVGCGTTQRIEILIVEGFANDFEGECTVTDEWHRYLREPDFRRPTDLRISGFGPHAQRVKLY